MPVGVLVVCATYLTVCTAF